MGPYPTRFGAGAFEPALLCESSCLHMAMLPREEDDEILVSLESTRSGTVEVVSDSGRLGLVVLRLAPKIGAN
jgi:hypothetical protein